ncbi:PLP-dependent aminotransferase family protein [Aquibium sp. A9E412]|uniref:aminotransferase-like domain-containing protein n=1 Tax=Aquibium sp. A9E412 TaxID=2976767 RepID=UPI0025B151B4|nr:PLP-dependent aminotransferase family protein [Aquibium sp. A9E412]MDN2567615.1 PLP-dependent aminotransferase family protein [Aquibium sp. A9E412]
MAIWHPRLAGRHGPKYLQIVEALADDVASGALPAGTRLPPHRALAHALGVSPHTASRAYAEAVARALIRGEVGRGSFVRGPGRRAAGGSAGDLRRPDDGPVDLARNLPCVGLAETALADTLRALGAGAGLAALTDSQSAADIRHHAEAAVAWLGRAGVSAGGDAVVATTGAQHGILCALMAATQPGDLLLTEALCYAPVRAMAARLALRLKPVEIDDEGLCPDALEAVCRGHRAAALYVAPTLHTPTTATMGPARRARIAAIAARYGVTLIEDDVFGPLKPDRPAPLATLAPERCFYVTSTSKCLAPGLRVGFVRAPAGQAGALRHAVGLTSWMTPPLMVEIVARWIADGTAERLTEAQRRHAARRQALAGRLLEGAERRADPHGLHLWLGLPQGWSAEGFAAEADRRGVRLVAGTAFAVDAAARPAAVRLCLSHEADEARVRRGLETVRAMLREGPDAAALVL